MNDTATVTEENHAISNARGWLSSILEMIEKLDEAENGIECGQCEGTGEITGGLGGDGEDEECPVCDGTGELNRYDYDDVRREIEESALSVEVRTNWHTPGGEDLEPTEYRVLLTCGGPALQIMGDLDGYGQPETAGLFWQDWGTPWTEYRDTSTDEDKALLKFAGCFWFGEG